jgi:putative polyhydroxyalkanoate system protein
VIVVRRHHDLGLGRAKRLAETIARRLQADYGGWFTWRENDLHFGRTGASGRLEVTKDSFQVHVELGFLLRPMRRRIEREIRAFCDEQLGEAERPDRGRPTRRAVRRAKATGSSGAPSARPGRSDGARRGRGDSSPTS